MSEALAKHHHHHQQQQQQQQQHHQQQHQHRSSLPGATGATNGDPHRGISPTGSTVPRKKHRSRRNSQPTSTANEMTTNSQKNFNELDAEKSKNNALDKHSEIMRGELIFPNLISLKKVDKI